VSTASLTVADLEPQLFTVSERGRGSVRYPSTTATRTLARELPDRYRVVAEIPKTTGDGFAFLDLEHFASVIRATGLNLLVLDVPATVNSQTAALQDIKHLTLLSWGEIGDILGVSRTSVDAWLKGQTMSLTNQIRLLTVRDILARAADRHTDLRAWLLTPTGSDGCSPFDLLKSGDVDRVRYLALTSTAAPVAPPLAGARRLRRGLRREFVKEARPPEPISEANHEEEEGAAE